MITAKSERSLLKKLSEEIDKLTKAVRDIYQLQLKKAEINRDIVHGVKEEGYGYSDKLPGQKEKIVGIIDKQSEQLTSVIASVSKVQELFNLLVHMEQSSLAIDADLKRDDLACIIDVHTMPLEKFKKEIEQLKMLASSFSILKIELE